MIGAYYSWKRFIQDGLWGYKDILTGETVIPAQYDFLDSYQGSEYCPAYKDGKWGAINRNNEQIAPFRYQKISPFWDGKRAQVCYNNLWGFIDNSGTEIIPLIYDSIEELINADDQVKVSKAGKYGITDSCGRIIIPCQFDEIEYIRHIFGYYRVTRGDKQFFLDKTGKPFTLQRYNSDYHINLGGCFYSVCKDGFWGVVDDNNVEVIPFQYNRPLGKLPIGGNTRDDLIPACVHEEWGFVDLLGNVRIPFIFDSVRQGASGLFPAREKGCWGLLDSNGEWRFPPLFDDLHFWNGLATVCKNNKWGMIDEKGNVIIPFEYDSDKGLGTRSLDRLDIEHKGGFWTEISVGGKCGLLSPDRRILVPIQFDEVGMPNETIVPVKLNSLWGFYDILQGVVIPCQYDVVKLGFYSEYAVVSKNNVAHLINRKGDTILEADYISILDDDNFIVKRGGYYGVIDIRGRIITPFEIESVSIYNSCFHPGSFFASKGNKWAVVSPSGELLTSYVFSLSSFKHPIDFTPQFWDSIARVKNGDLEGFVDTWGTFVVDPIWKKNVYDPSHNRSTGTRMLGRSLYNVYFTDWNGIKRVFSTHASSKAEAEQNWLDSGVAFGATIDSIV